MLEPLLLKGKTMTTINHAVLVSAYGNTRVIEFAETPEMFLQYFGSDNVFISKSVAGSFIAGDTRNIGNLQATAYHKLATGEPARADDFEFYGSVIFVPERSHYTNAERFVEAFKNAPIALGMKTFVQNLR